jgi:hypothetical protein
LQLIPLINCSRIPLFKTLIALTKHISDHLTLFKLDMKAGKRHLKIAFIHYRTTLVVKVEILTFVQLKKYIKLLRDLYVTNIPKNKTQVNPINHGYLVPKRIVYLL